MRGYKLLLPRHVKQMNREYKEIIPQVDSQYYQLKY
jgi:hypothetical protein